MNYLSYLFENAKKLVMYLVNAVIDMFNRKMLEVSPPVAVEPVVPVATNNYAADVATVINQYNPVRYFNSFFASKPLIDESMKVSPKTQTEVVEVAEPEVDAVVVDTNPALETTEVIAENNERTLLETTQEDENNSVYRL